MLVLIIKLKSVILSIFKQKTDVNECLANNGDCDQKCTNTPGSYYCSCDSGFYLDPEYAY